MYIIQKYAWNFVSINLYNLCLDNKNEITFVTDNPKTLFRMSQQIIYLNHEGNVNVIKKCNDFYFKKVTQHLNHYVIYFEIEFYIIFH